MFKLIGRWNALQWHIEFSGPTGPARSWTLATCYRSMQTSVASTMAPLRRVSESDAATMNLVGPTGPARSWTLATCYRSKRTSVASTMAPLRRVSESDAATMNLVGPTGPARSWTLATCYRSKRTSVASTMAPLRRVSESDAAIMNLVPLNGSDRLDRGICEATLGGRRETFSLQRGDDDGIRVLGE